MDIEVHMMSLLIHMPVDACLRVFRHNTACLQGVWDTFSNETLEQVFW